VEFITGEGATELIHEQVAETRGQHAHRQEEAGFARDPACLVWRNPAAGDNAVEMRVVVQCLPPGVQHRNRAGLGAEVAAVSGNLAKGLGGSAEENGIDDLLVVERDLRGRGGRVNTTWKYGTGNRSAWRASSHSARASVWHFGQCLSLHEL
jgi:hypothetical protein